MNISPEKKATIPAVPWLVLKQNIFFLSMMMIERIDLIYTSTSRPHGLQYSKVRIATLNNQTTQ